MTEQRRLGAGFVSAGFVTRFHVQVTFDVRDANIGAVMSPTRTRAAEVGILARDLGVGYPQVYTTVTDMANDPAVDAPWLCAPNDTRLAFTEEMMSTVKGDEELNDTLCHSCEVARFLLTAPDETWDDGLAITEVLMASYASAEKGRVVTFPEPELASFVPKVAQGTWLP